MAAGGRLIGEAVVTDTDERAGVLVELIDQSGDHAKSWWVENGKFPNGTKVGDTGKVHYHFTGIRGFVTFEKA